MKENGERLEVALTFSNIPVRAKMMGILKEEALKAGLKFILDGLDHTVVYKKEMQKKHQAVFSAWGFQPPYPRYYEYFHSSNASTTRATSSTTPTTCSLLRTSEWINWRWPSAMPEPRTSWRVCS